MQATAWTEAATAPAADLSDKQYAKPSLASCTLNVSLLLILLKHMHTDCTHAC